MDVNKDRLDEIPSPSQSTQMTSHEYKLTDWLALSQTGIKTKCHTHKETG